MVSAAASDEPASAENPAQPTTVADARSQVTEADAENVRYASRWLRTHREKLGLSAEDYGRLIGVTGQDWPAVAAGATIFTVLFIGLNFLRMGTTGITAHAFGAGDNDAIREALARSLLTALSERIVHSHKYARRE